MSDIRPKRILFTGYAPVHFLCYLPVYQRLSTDPRVELWLSGGWKRADGDTTSYSLDGFYDPFPVERARVIPIERARQEDFDVLVCAHLSDSLFPRSAGHTVQIFHGVSFKNLAVRDKALRFDTLCLPGRYHAELYRETGLVRRGGPRYLITGFPKVDPLRAGAEAGARARDRRALLTGLGLDPAVPTLLLAPTGDKHNALETMGEELIEAIGADGRFNLLVKPHDHPKLGIDWFRELAPLEGARVRLVRDRDVVPYLAAADLLLTDASSVAVEFTLLDRPIIFLDVPRLFQRVEKRAPNLDLTTYGRRIGAIVERPGDVVAAVTTALADPGREREIRQAMARHVFWDPGHAADRVAGVVLNAAGICSDLPTGIETLIPAADVETGT